ncbi:hypothetical protein A2955_03790 [Candidatus Woesebacteria bacterium RIFCSPLOWO2_01_FULL_37_19]|uniref:ABC transporter substrate-binding protein n=2 Tax=Candidatus Woeseibacteriota TaxID=1752722 RepID=A0A1F8AXY6_9BACT|nr:MAG: hypothetical protein A2771_03795 [Candidatus Woesebacteria bacterium RIFCSPHIGHO2_01_FULL_38_26b]OGM56624.1 MAG: hypothetical protein A2955_03790 [Candidatus Woesebacteria bacterium RIFCSPLOWO2_01_FULL_37_19]
MENNNSPNNQNQASPTNQNPAINQSPQNAIVGGIDIRDENLNPNSQNPTGPQPPIGKTAPPFKAVNKSGFLKKILFVLIFILLAGVIIFALTRSKNPILDGGGNGNIVWWGMFLEENDVSGLVDEFQEQNPNVKITYVKQSPTDYRERLANALAAGNGPDIFEIHDSWPYMFLEELAVMPDSIYSTEEYNSTFYPAIISDMTTNKGIIGIPLEYDALTLFINEDIFASGAKTPPKTWDELRRLAEEFTQKGEEGKIIQAGVALGNTKNVDYWQDILGFMLLQNGADPANPVDNKATDAVSYYTQFTNLGVWNSTLPNSTRAFALGKVAMYLGPSKSSTEIVKENPNLKYRTVNLPQLPKNKPTDVDVSYVSYWTEGVAEQSKNKDAAWLFLKFLTTKESLAKLNQNYKQRTKSDRVSPRIDMSQLYINDKIVGSIVSLASSAKSWYLADNTNDGPQGLNSQLGAIYADILNIESGKYASPKDAAEDISKVLSQYDIPLD